jgi:hypothetical protein
MVFRHFRGAYFGFCFLFSDGYEIVGNADTYFWGRVFRQSYHQSLYGNAVAKNIKKIELGKDGVYRIHFILFVVCSVDFGLLYKKLRLNSAVFTHNLRHYRHTISLLAIGKRLYSYKNARQNKNDSFECRQHGVERIGGYYSVFFQAIFKQLYLGRSASDFWNFIFYDFFYL